MPCFAITSALRDVGAREARLYAEVPMEALAATQSSTTLPPRVEHQDAVAATSIRIQADKGEAAQVGTGETEARRPMLTAHLRGWVQTLNWVVRREEDSADRAADGSPTAPLEGVEAVEAHRHRSELAGMGRAANHLKKTSSRMHGRLYPPPVPRDRAVVAVAVAEPMKTVVVMALLAEMA